MITSEIMQSLKSTVKSLAGSTPGEKPIYTGNGHQLPSVIAVRELNELMRRMLFPEFFDTNQSASAMRPFHIGVSIEKFYTLLEEQIAASLYFDRCREDCEDCRNCSIEAEASRMALNVTSNLPEIKRKLLTDIRAIFHNDPAVSNEAEVIFCYPSIQAMMYYRFANFLHGIKVPLLPRILTEIAHSKTGIDIHPGATIGDYFSIDHGTGVVIGETCIIGKHVTIYQGVTLGAKNFSLDSNGHPINIPRHPIIEDNVTIYSNASVLGRITIGHDSIIGGNVWVTHNVPPHSRILQRTPRTDTFIDGAGI